MRRIVSCQLLKGHRKEAMPPRDSGAQVKSPKWLNVWQFERNGKTVTVAIEVHTEAGVEVVHARDFIERLLEFPPGAGFDIYAEDA